jgi:hypothetical protein
VIRHGPRALQLAVIYAGMGEKDTAFARLNHAYEDCSYILALHFTTDARLDTLHSEAGRCISRTFPEVPRAP